MHSGMRTFAAAGLLALGGLLWGAAGEAQAQVVINTPGLSLGVGTPYGGVYPGYGYGAYPGYGYAAYPAHVAVPVPVLPYPVVRPYPYYGHSEYYGGYGGHHGGYGGYGGHHGGYGGYGGHHGGDRHH